MPQVETVPSIARNCDVLICRWQVPTRSFLFVLPRWQEHVTGMSRFSQPGHNFHQVRFGHRRATGSRSIDSTPNMKKYCASGAGNRWIRIVPNLDEPVISEIA